MFEEIYQTNTWGSDESLSGGGSTENRTRELRDEIKKLIQDFNIGSIVDCGCGDFNWMRKLLADVEVDYLGLDIASTVIRRNIESYGNDKIKFREHDLVENIPPTGDLLICREVLFHLSHADIRHAITNVCNSGSKYFLVTSSRVPQYNLDIPSGSYRELDMQCPPLSLPEPLLQLVDSANRAMQLFSIEQLISKVDWLKK